MTTISTRRMRIAGYASLFYIVIAVISYCIMALNGYREYHDEPALLEWAMYPLYWGVTLLTAFCLLTLRGIVLDLRGGEALDRPILLYVFASIILEVIAQVMDAIFWPPLSNAWPPSGIVELVIYLVTAVLTLYLGIKIRKFASERLPLLKWFGTLELWIGICLLLVILLPVALVVGLYSAVILARFFFTAAEGIENGLPSEHGDQA